MSKQPVVAITGANGFLGSVLQKHFLAKGWQVRALVRTPGKPKKNLSYATYDLTQPIDDTILTGVDYLVHAAYVKQTSARSGAFDSNVLGAKQILAASRANKLKKNVFISSMSSHPGAISVYGRQKLRIEKTFNGKQDISLRPGLIIGNGGLVKNLVTFMKKRRVAPLIGGGKQPLQIVSVDDLAIAIDTALTSTASGIYTIAHPTVYQYKDFYKKVARHLHIRVLFLPIPFGLLLALFNLVDFLHLPLAVGKDNLLGLKKLIAVDTAPDLKKLGLTLDDLDQALKKSDLQ